MSTSPLIGLKVTDHGVVGGLVGTITHVSSDGMVGITWQGRIGVAYIRPTAGRFTVEVPAA